MLYYLFHYLDTTFDFPGAGVFKYVSFRAMATLILSLFISTIIGRRLINKLQLMQIGEIVRDLGLEGQMSKKGTPTMGGVIIIISILIPCLLLGRLGNIYMILMLITTAWLGLIGFLDDYIKVFKKDKEGLHGRFKIVGQVGLGIIVAAVMYLSPNITIRENVEIIKEGDILRIEHKKENIKLTQTTIPFVKNNNLDYSDLVPFVKESAKQNAGWILFALVTIFIVIAVSNGANLTDGLDGLATGSSAIIGVTLGILAYVSGHVEFASYLNIMYIPGCEELTIFISAFIGATVGFLWYNAFPAQVFMGDTGSLTLGGIIAVFAIVIHKELLIPILCGVFVVENLSVVLQVAFFKMTKRKTGVGKRIFKMTPLHHHFQKRGYSGVEAVIQRPVTPVPESKIVVRFWIIGIILAVITLVTLKLR
ncbi:MAG: phospho-N-acetylmuramoyl-pentapeptide-transferase [Candidatus Azobacteroides sp.]|jgi:phospho-N-acetylmuramoyl-pentapeptide-transferase|nr:phospho-N-acetylmuramoyl-pentapeptide-transferase [Candidatus Azobacteroides sp.]